MRAFGDLSGIVVNVSTGNVVGGHQRLKHLDPEWEIVKKPSADSVGTVALGHIETPFGRWFYREVAWDERKEKAANIAANKHGGEFDIPLLKELLIELDDGALDISLTGFSQEEFEELISGEQTETEAKERGFGVVVTCDSEKQEKALLKKLEAEGFTCRAVSQKKKA